MDTTPTFKRGDLVRWTCQGGGTTAHHVGVVVVEVPAAMPVGMLLSGLAHRYSLRAIASEGSRTERSYLVARTDMGGRGKARLHWPHASTLRSY